MDRRMLARSRAVGRRRWLVPALLVALVAVLGLGAYALWFSPWLAVRQVSVQGTEDPGLVGEAEEAAREQVGVPMVRADLGGVESRVAADKRFRSVSVTRRWPSTILVSVEPRVAALAWKNPQGQVEVADRDGVTFEKAATPPEGLPVVTVTDGKGTSDRLSQVPLILEAMPADLRGSVRSISVSGIADVDTQLADMLVRWGDGSRAQDKVAAVQALRRTSEARTKDVVIDVSAPDAPAVLAPHAPAPETPSKH